MYGQANRAYSLLCCNRLTKILIALYISAALTRNFSCSIYGRRFLLIREQKSGKIPTVKVNEVVTEATVSQFLLLVI